MHPNTTKPLPQPILSVRIPADLLSHLDHLSSQTGLARSEVVRIALTQGMPTVQKIADILRNKE